MISDDAKKLLKEAREVSLESHVNVVEVLLAELIVMAMKANEEACDDS